MKIGMFVAAAALLAASSAIAGPRPLGAVEEKNLLSGKQKFDPASGYIYMHGPFRQTGVFLKVPEQIDVDEYTAEWEEAYTKAEAKYKKRMLAWEKNARIAKSQNAKPPVKPDEVTRETFTIGYLETRNAAWFGPEYVFNKAKGEDEKFYSYLHQVPPGTYIYYGPIFANPQGGFIGTCYCMGSVKVEVKAGTITNLGNFLLAAPNEAKQKSVVGKPMVVPVGLMAQTVNADASTAKLSYDLPASLQSYPNEIGDMRAAGKMNNFFGIAVSRLAPIDGVLEYKRDQVIDVKAAASPEAGVDIAGGS